MQSLAGHGVRLQLLLIQLCPEGHHMRTPLVTIHHLDKLSQPQLQLLPYPPEQMRAMAKHVTSMTACGLAFEEPVLAYLHVTPALGGPLPHPTLFSVAHFYFLLPVRPTAPRPLLLNDATALQHLNYVPMIHGDQAQHAYAINALSRIPSVRDAQAFFEYYTRHDTDACRAERQAIQVLSCMHLHQDPTPPPRREKRRRRPAPPPPDIEPPAPMRGPTTEQGLAVPPFPPMERPLLLAAPAQ